MNRSNRSKIKSFFTSTFPDRLTLFLIALVSFASIVSFAQTPQAVSQSDIASRVDQIFTRWDRPDSPGCILGVIKKAGRDWNGVIPATPYHTRTA
jgi:hypothetical protein